MTMKFADGTRATTTDDLIRWFGEWCATKTTDPIPFEGENSITVSRDSLTHYGHFPLAQCIRERSGRTRVCLLNGDSYSGGGGWGPSTGSRQQSTRSAMISNGVPHVTIPFSALEGARIDRNTIKVIAQREDRHTIHEVSSRVRPGRYEDRDLTEPFYPSRAGMEHAWVESDAVLGDDGVWRWTVRRHWLGDCVIRAATRTWDRETGREVVTWGTYLSSFDYNESRPLYFLCELPRSVRISELKSVDDAIEALKPPEVVNALANGLDVIRQGDVFAIPTSMTTRELRKMEQIIANNRILGTNHTVTEVIVTMDDDTYGRGIMRHAPEGWRPKDHADVTLGDRKTWYRLVKNTVPVATGRQSFNQRGQARAWTSTGTVD